MCVCALSGPGDPCRTTSLSVDGSHPYLNPCGSFACSVDPGDPSTNICGCEDPFVMVTNTDGTRTCAYSEYYFSFLLMPCCKKGVDG